MMVMMRVRVALVGVMVVGLIGLIGRSGPYPNPGRSPVNLLPALQMDANSEPITALVYS
jgi:hypothetical protein